VKPYEVRVAESARRDIRDIARYIAEEHPDGARRWLNTIWDAMLDLGALPRRAARAPQSAHLDYEVRRRVVSEHLVFFTIDEAAQIVYVLRVWPARRQPLEPDELALPDVGEE